MPRPRCKKKGHKLADRPDGYKYCITCSRLKAKSRAKDPKVKAANKKRYVKRNSTIAGHCDHLMVRIKKTHKDCNFDSHYLQSLWGAQEGKCAITGTVLSIEKGKGRLPFAASLDRINPDAGYRTTNVRFVCDIVNIMKQHLTDAELLMWSKRVVAGFQATGKKEILIPNFSTVADIFDRLVVEVSKLGFYENSKRQESLKENPDLELIVKWDRLSRDCCEYRDMLKTAINQTLENIIINQHYQTIPSSRTFLPPKRSVADLLAEQCESIGTATKTMMNKGEDNG